MPQISVIVPVYNVEKYLHRCIDSILGQTFSDFELILVDDGSLDNCGAICDGYAMQDSRVRVIHQENSGISAARNAGVKIAQGEWISFIDSDDCVHPCMLDSLYREATMSGAIAICGAVEELDIPKLFFEGKDVQFSTAVVDDDELQELFYKKYSYWVAWGKLIPRSIVIKFPFQNGRVYEDNAIVFKWLIEAGKVVYTDAPLYFYQVNSLGTSKSGFHVKRFDYLWALREQAAFYKKNDYPAMYEIVEQTYIWSAADLIKKGREHSVGKMILLKEKILWDWKMLSMANQAEKIQENRLWMLSHVHPMMMEIYWRTKGILAKTKNKKKRVEKKK